MNYDLLLQHVARHISLDNREADFFISLLQHRELKKKELLVKEGEICRYEHFVLKGCFKSYSVDEKGNEHIIFFAPEEWWIGDLYSFLTGSPAQYTTEALEDSVIVQISKKDLEELYIRVPKFERFFRILFQNALIAQTQRVDSSLSLSADEKYTRFLEKYPQLEQRIPQKLVASFLGITPEFLSVIRRKMVGGKR